MHTLKTTKVLTAVLTAVLLCTGCSDQTVPTASNTGSIPETAQPPAESEASASKENTKSIDAIYQEIEQTVSLQSPQRMDDDFISNYYGIDATILEEYVFSMSEDAAQAETVIIMKVKNADDLTGLTESLQTVVDEKKNEMENYIPEQFAIVEKSKVQTKDNYVWLVISDNADAITDIIENGLS